MARLARARVRTRGAALPAAALAVWAFAFWLRAMPAPRILRPQGVAFPTLTDELYHMRRIWYSVVRFPEVLGFDPYGAFPNGSRVVWPPVFDWGVAALARALVGAGDQAAVERVAVWVPPLLGALTAAAILVFAWRAWSPAAGLVAGLWLALLPAHFFQTEVGMLDHHCAVELGHVLLLGVAIGLFAPRAGGPPRRARAAALGLAMGGLLALWPGALLSLAVVQAVGVAWMLLAPERAIAVARARALAIAHAVALVVVTPLCVGPPWPELGAWTPLALSRFQPAWLGAAALVCSGCALLWRRTSLGERRNARAASGLGLGAFGLAAALAYLPGLAATLAYSAGWFSGGEEVLQHVVELRPLLFPRDALRLDIAAKQLSNLVFVFPILWLALSAQALRRREGADRWLVLAWSAAFGAAALAQLRFASTFAVGFSYGMGLLAHSAWPALRRACAGRPGRAALALALGIPIAALVLDPVLSVYRDRRAEAHRGVPDLNPVVLPNRLAEQAGLWLRANSAPTAGWLDAALRPEYGVLSSWGVGHVLRYRSERPVVTDNFGSYAGHESWDLAWRYFEATDEAEAVDILERLGVRYVVADRLGPGSSRRPAQGSMTQRLAGLFGSEGPAVAGPGAAPMPALERHRMVLHLRSGGGEGLAAPPPHHAMAVYEIVPGALLEGEAAPGARVEARLALQTRSGASHQHRTSTRADRDGRWRLVVPYSNERFSSAVEAGPEWWLESGGRRARVAVSEAAVRSGARVQAPSLAP